MKFLYSVLPQYSKNIDNITDTNRFGNKVKILEEYLDTLDEEIFEIIQSKIKDFSTFTSIDNIPLRYLPYLAYILGYIWDFTLSYDYQKYILKSIVEIYKRKGTEFSVRYGLDYFDFNAETSEPYKYIFELNKHKLNDKYVFPSEDYYSRGIYVVKTTIDPDTVKSIVENVKPAGVKLIIDYMDSSLCSSLKRIDSDRYYDILERYYDFDPRYKDFQQFLDISILRNYMLFEDLSGYIIKGNVKTNSGIYKLDNTNYLSSQKKIFVNRIIEFALTPTEDLRDEYSSIYMGQTILDDSPFTAEDLFSHRTLDTKLTKNYYSLHTNKRVQKINNFENLLNTTEDNNNMSFFKNFIEKSHVREGENGTFILNTSDFILGDRKWLEFDKSPYKNSETFSVYMDSLLPYWSDIDKYEIYDDFKYEDFDKITRAYAPKTYSKKSDIYLVKPLYIDDKYIQVNSIDNLKERDVVCINNEVIEYDGISDSEYFNVKLDGNIIQLNNDNSYYMNGLFNFIYRYDNNLFSIQILFNKIKNIIDGVKIYKNKNLLNIGTEYSYSFTNEKINIDIFNQNIRNLNVEYHLNPTLKIKKRNVNVNNYSLKEIVNVHKRKSNIRFMKVDILKIRDLFKYSSEFLLNRVVLDPDDPYYDIFKRIYIHKNLCKYNISKLNNKDHGWFNGVTSTDILNFYFSYFGQVVLYNTPNKINNIGDKTNNQYAKVRVAKTEVFKLNNKKIKLGKTYMLNGVNF